MRLWFAPSSEVPIYRQLVTQVELAILSGDLRPGAKLPSTRELARRFALHPNTVSAGYRKLEAEGWTERRRGSGVYVRGVPAGSATPQQELDRHIQSFFQTMRERNIPALEVRERLARWLAAPPPDHLLAIDPDPEFSRFCSPRSAAPPDTRSRASPSSSAASPAVSPVPSPSAAPARPRWSGRPCLRAWN